MVASEKRFCARDLLKLDWRAECPVCGSDGIDTGKRIALDQLEIDGGPDMASQYYDHNFEARQYKCGRGHDFKLIINRNEIAKRHGGVYAPATDEEGGK